MQNQAAPTAQVNVRALRQNMTDSERKRWSGRRGEQLGFKFRHQHPLANCIADFVCLFPQTRGRTRRLPAGRQPVHDLARDAFFGSQGFAVLGFPFNAPFQNLDGVLSAILHQLNGLTGVVPIPAFPQRGRGQISLKK